MRLLCFGSMLLVLSCAASAAGQGATALGLRISLDKNLTLKYAAGRTRDELQAAVSVAVVKKLEDNWYSFCWGLKPLAATAAAPDGEISIDVALTPEFDNWTMETHIRRPGVTVRLRNQRLPLLETGDIAIGRNGPTSEQFADFLGERFIQIYLGNDHWHEVHDVLRAHVPVARGRALPGPMVPGVPDGWGLVLLPSPDYYTFRYSRFRFECNETTPPTITHSTGQGAFVSPIAVGGSCLLVKHGIKPTVACPAGETVYLEEFCPAPTGGGGQPAPVAVSIEGGPSP